LDLEFCLLAQPRRPALAFSPPQSYPSEVCRLSAVDQEHAKANAALFPTYDLVKTATGSIRAVAAVFDHHSSPGDAGCLAEHGVLQWSRVGRFAQRSDLAAGFDGLVKEGVEIDHVKAPARRRAQVSLVIAVDHFDAAHRGHHVRRGT